MAALILYAMPLFNGIYNRCLVDYPELFWSLDAFQFVVLPAAVAIALFRFGHLRIATIGLEIPTGASDRRRLAAHSLIALFVYPALYLSLRRAFIFLYPVSVYPAAFDYSWMTPENPVLRTLTSAYYGLTAGIGEEFLFRGLLVAIFARAGLSAPTIVVVVSAMFGLVHWESGYFNILSTMTLSMMLTTYYLKTRWLLPLIAGHFATDFYFFLTV